MLTTSLLLLATAAGSPAAETPVRVTTLPVAQRTTRARSAPRVRSGDADPRGGGRVHLKTETADSATRVVFTYRGRRVAARRTSSDAEDRTRDWARTVPARGARPGQVVRFRVTACGSGGCSSRTFSDRLDREDD